MTQTPKVEKKCRSCGSDITAEMIEAKRKQKSDRIKAAKQGQGAPRRYDYDLIKRLLIEGQSAKHIMSVVGCSTWPIQLARIELRLNQDALAKVDVK